MTAYYNEFDHAAACGLRELIKLGMIAPGDVDERSILEVKPDDVRGYTQCHWFAGAGVWSYALRRAGWPDDRPVWTGSCPCQDFSCAGAGKGTKGHRDLWPVFAALIRERRPDRVFGEQVEAAIGYGWLDRLRADLEAENYAVGSVVLGAHSAGAPHIRQRLYWVAESEHFRYSRQVQSSSGTLGWRSAKSIVGGGDSRLADTETPIGRGVRQEHAWGRTAEAGGPGGTGGMGESDRSGYEGQRGLDEQHDSERRQETRGCFGASGFWSRAVAIPCRDGKARLAEPGIFPLVDGLARGMVHSGDPCLPEYANNTAEARQMRLKWYGNAIVAETAIAFLQAFLHDETQNRGTRDANGVHQVLPG